MTTLNALTTAIAALPGAIAACKTKVDALNAEIVTLKAAQVPQATIDDLTAQVNAAIAALEAITALA